MFKELGRNPDTTFIPQENRGAIDWAEGGPAKHFARRKHIDIKFNIAMRLINDSAVKLEKVNTNEMIVGYLKKPLAPGVFPNKIKRCKIFLH